MYKIMDRVRVIGGQTGTIMRITPQHSGIDLYTVEFDDQTLFPTRMDYTERDLYLYVDPEDTAEVSMYNPNIIKSGPSCECGVVFVRDGGKHSDYCPLYKK
jgi:hypothetical protein